jgi:hypothetical protein
MLSPCFKGHRIVLPRLVFAHHYYRQKGFLPKRRNQSSTLHKESDFADFSVKQKWGRGEGYQNHQRGISSGQQIKA